MGPAEQARLARAARDAIACPLNVSLQPFLDRLERALTPFDAEDDWAMLTELYRTLVRAGAGSAEKRHKYSFARRRGTA